MFSPHEVIALLLIGLGSGLVGGLLGFGGSILMIPMLTSFLDRDQHLTQAAAMIVNGLIAGPALYRHHRARAVSWPLVRRLVPVAVVAILLGVLLGNQVDGLLLRRGLGLFLVYVIGFDIVKIIGRHRVHPRRHRHHGRPAHIALGWRRSGLVGGLVGVPAGLLGIGGGPIAVPLLQWVCGRSLREAIAASTALMCLTSVAGAILKNATLSDLTGADGAPLVLIDSLNLAMSIAPGAIVGAWIGASLTHRFPPAWLRGILLTILSGAALLMLFG